MWIDSELIAYEWFKTNYDSNAILYGNTDSTKSDIYSPLLNEFIEIKQLCPSARCGQFTVTTAKYSICKEVMNHNQTETNAKEFVRLHYGDKNISKFLIVLPNKIILEDIDDFLNNHHFKWQTYAKKSGTTSAAKKYYSILSDNLPTEIKNNKIYVTNELLVGKYFWFEDKEFYISKNNSTYGEIRQCSKVKNITWLVEVTQ